jgi:hypothetical protein
MRLVAVSRAARLASKPSQVTSAAVLDRPANVVHAVKTAFNTRFNAPRAERRLQFLSYLNMTARSIAAIALSYNGRLPTNPANPLG